jgi:uncharacterized protein
VTAKFAEGVETMADLQIGMELEGTVTNVTQFGAFVDIGVHQDGLVHVSQLADRFIKEAREVVRAGQTVKVRVVEVDLPRKRIALTMKLQGAPTAPSPRETRGTRPAGGNVSRNASPGGPGGSRDSGVQRTSSRVASPAGESGFGDALSVAIRKR